MWIVGEYERVDPPHALTYTWRLEPGDGDVQRVSVRFEARDGATSAPVLRVADVAASAAYYRDKLGFKYDRFWGDPPTFCMPQRDHFVVMLKQVDDRRHVIPHYTVAPDTWNAYFWVDDVEALFAEFKERGATIDYELCNQPYGVREFGIQDLDRYDIAFGQDHVGVFALLESGQRTNRTLVASDEFGFAKVPQKSLRANAQFLILGHEQSELVRQVDVCLVVRSGGKQDALAPLRCGHCTHKLQVAHLSIATENFPLLSIENFSL